MKTCILFAVLAVGTVFGQEFDVASIRPSAPVGMSYSTNINSGEGTLRTKNTTLFDLILFALKAQPYQVSGGPGWVRDLRFDISAKSLDEEKRPKAVTKAEKDAEDERFRARVRNLLADRFQLKLSEQEKDLPVYAMTVEKTGHKLKPSTAEDGNVNGNRTGDKGSLVATGIETESIAEVLGGDCGQAGDRPDGAGGAVRFRAEVYVGLGCGRECGCGGGE